MKTSYRVSLLIVLLISITTKIHSQQKSIDSLQMLLSKKNIKESDKIHAYANLMEAYNSLVSMDKELEKTIEFTKRQKTPEYKAISYAYSSMYYARNDSIMQAYAAIENCRYYMNKSSDIDIKSISLLKILKAKLMLDDNSDVVDELFSLYHLYQNEHNLKMLCEIYYTFYIYHFSLGDTSKIKMYAELCLNYAIKSNNNNLICRAWHAYAASLRLIEREHIKADPNYKNQPLRDSIFHTLSQAIQIYERHKGDVQFQAYTLALSNMANHYSMDKDENKKYSNPDSILYYADKALKVSIEFDDAMVQAQMNLTKAYVSIDKEDYLTAEDIIKKTFLIIDNGVKDTYHNTSLNISLYSTLSGIYEKQQLYKEAFEELKQAYFYQKKSWQKKYIREGQIADAKFKVEESKHNLALSQQQAKQQKQILVWSILAALLFILFMIVFYQMRLRNSKQKAQILKKEKEEARLQAQIKEEEIRRIENEKRTIELEKELEKEKAIRKAEQVNRLQKELIVGTAQLDRKNEMLEKIKERLGKDFSKVDYREVERLLVDDKKSDDNFEEFSGILKKIHPDFYSKLQEKAAQKLTALDLKYCTYIFMNLSSKDIANILFVDPKTVRTTKYRLKQKLELDKDKDMTLFIQNILNNQ